MPLTKFEAENFTVFEDITIPFSRGLNVLLGENGVGKTLMQRANHLNTMYLFHKKQLCFFDQTNLALED